MTGITIRPKASEEKSLEKCGFDHLNKGHPLTLTFKLFHVFG